MELVKIPLRLLPNETLFSFTTENGEYFTKYNPETLGIAEYMPDYNASLTAFRNSLEPIEKSADTERIAKADEDFNESYRALSGYVKSCLLHYSVTVRRAAENLSPVFAKYGNIGRNPYSKELGMSKNLRQELSEREDDVKAMGLTPWINAHAAKAEVLDELIKARTYKDSKKVRVRTIDARRQLEAIHKKIVDRLDAMINIHGENYVEGFVAEYNAHATRYKNALAQHLGRLHKKSDDKNTDTVKEKKVDNDVAPVKDEGVDAQSTTAEPVED